MRNLFSGKTLFASLVIFTFFIGSTGYSQEKTNKKIPRGSVILKYNYPSDKSIKYESNSKIIQDMDIDGQSMLVDVSVFLGCRIKSAGQLGENLRLEIAIDSMAQFIDSPQGASGGAVNDAKGKVFNIVVTPSGTITDLSEAAEIAVNIPGSGESDISENFLDFFPTLPTGPVKKGDTWTTHDTINSKTQTSMVWMSVKSDCKFEGTEKLDRIKCAKISATLTGSRKMTNQSQGMQINSSGTFTGTSILFFAVKEGYFVKQDVTSRMPGNMEISDMGMSFPVIMDIVSTNEIVKQ